MSISLPSSSFLGFAVTTAARFGADVANGLDRLTCWVCRQGYLGVGRGVRGISRKEYFGVVALGELRGVHNVAELSLRR